MPFDHDQIANLDAVIDGLDSPTSLETWQATDPYDAGMVAASAVRRALAGGGGGGSSSIKSVDLGVIDIPSLFSGAPPTLYEMEDGEFLATIRFTDTDFVAPDYLPNRMPFGIGTAKSFSWWTFASDYSAAGSGWIDTLALAATGSAYGPDLANAGITAQVISAAAGGPITAGVYDYLLSPTGNGILFADIADWAADTEYATEVTDVATAAFPGLKAAILANGTIWVNTGAAGVSGGSAPDFAGNAAGTVEDGDDIVWTDATDVPPTVGAIHAVAEIWTPS